MFDQILRAAHALLAIALAAALFSPLLSARTVTPRGELTAEERVTIDVFEKAKRSVVHISTSER